MTSEAASNARSNAPSAATTDAARDAIKRAMDLALVVPGLVALAPLMLGVGVAVGVALGRPVLFRQARAGRGGVPFDVIKFRTMREAKPGQEGPEFDSLRLTPFGQFLRSTSLDELPSLINVLRGEMSLVGPRPLPVRYVPRYSARQARRLEVKPGVTGLAQVRGRNTLSWDQKFDADIEYVESWSVLLDLKLLLETVGTVVSREGVSQDGHVTMAEFMGTDVEPEP